MFVYNAARWFECQPDFTFPFEQTKVDTDYRPQGHSPQGRWDCTHHSYWKCWRIGTSQNHFQQCWNLHARLGNMPTINPPLLPTLLFYYRSKSNSAWIFFSGVCGNITFANDNNHQTRFAFIKFEKRENSCAILQRRHAWRSCDQVSHVNAEVLFQQIPILWVQMCACL